MFDRFKAAIVRAAKRFDKWASGHEIARLPLSPDDSMHPMNQPFESMMCDKPPQGWMCTRVYGHAGPCAAIQLAEPDVQSFTRSQWDKLKEDDSTHLLRDSIAPPVYQRRPLTLPEIQRSMDEMRKPPTR